MATLCHGVKSELLESFLWGVERVSKEPYF